MRDKVPSSRAGVRAAQLNRPIVRRSVIFASIGALGIAGLASALAACGAGNEQITEIEGSATASGDLDGDIVTREATPAEVDDLRRLREMYVEVNRQFPLPEFPADTPRIKATKVLPTGEILLEDGRSVMLDGVTCVGIGVEYLRRWLQAPESSVVIVPTSSASTRDPIPVNLWIVERSVTGGESRVFPADAGVSSGWCRPQPTTTATLNDRYAALAKAFEKEWPAYAEPPR